MLVILLVAAAWAPANSLCSEPAGAARRPRAEFSIVSVHSGGEAPFRNFSVSNGAIGQNTEKSPVWKSKGIAEAGQGYFVFTSKHNLSTARGHLDPARLLAAIRQVEDWRGRDGAAGERGPWQITAAVWSRHMPGISFAQARHEGPARVCALKHVEYLRARLVAAEIDDNAFNLALAWNAGDGAVLRGRAPVRAYDYATRARNLYELP